MKGDKLMRRQKKWKQVLACMSAFAVTASMVPAGSVSAAETGDGTPYTAEGVYDVTVPHVIVNQIYGGSDDGNASHSFIELYNQSSDTVDLTGWRIAYRSSRDGDDSEAWKYLDLTGDIGGNGYYLIRCGETTGTDYQVPSGDQEWDIRLHNKGVSVALFSEDVQPGDDFAGAVTESNRPEGYVDLLAVQGNDEEEAQMPPVYEGRTEAVQSKKKAVRRVGFADTDNNADDADSLDYSETVDPEMGPHGPEGSGEEGGETDPGTGEQPGSGTPEETYHSSSFENGAALTLDRTGDVTLGEADPDGGVAEIVSYNSDNGKAYIVNGQQ